MHANVMALCFIEAELLLVEVLHCGNTHFRPFCSCDLDLDPMTFIIIYKFEPYSLEIYRTSYVKFFQSYRITACKWVHLVTHDHFRSRDKDGGNTVRTAVAGSLMVHANLMPLSFIEQELWLIDVLHCWNTDFRLFAPVTLTLT